jgi:hypothetical protein
LINFIELKYLIFINRKEKKRNQIRRKKKNI